MELKFLYHALASGLSGQITLPFHHTIEVKAPSALPFTGGYSSAREKEFRYEQILSFESAESVTTGSETANFYETLATSTIEGLNILNVVTADRVVARLASKYSKDKGERSVTFTGSHFANLRVAGCPLEVTIDPARTKTSRHSAQAQYGTFATSIDLKNCPSVERLDDGGLHVPQFGKVYLAESVVTSCYQSISMIRVVLGCAVEGHLALLHASTNGEPMPG